jgi:hypothetical protein
MASAGSRGAAVALPRPRSRADHAEPPTLEAAAWLWAVPCALLVIVALLVLGPPLGSLLSPGRGSDTFLREAARAVLPEPTEHARYLIALTLPLMLSLAVLATARRRPALSARATAIAVALAQAGAVGVLAASIVIQGHLRYGLVYTEGQGEGILTLQYFKPPTLAVAGVLAAAALAGVRVAAVRDRVAALLYESRTRRLSAGAAALLITGIWMLHAVHTDTSLAALPLEAEDVRFHLGFTMDETFAVINGLTPLVDFTAQYATLWPFPTALVMVAFGKTALAFTLTMCVLTSLALLALYGVLRRASRSSLAALLLYVPFLATSVFMLAGNTVQRSTVGSYFGALPLRYAAPFLLAWLTARQLERGTSRRGTVLLFTAAGLTVLNNVDFGVPALGATIAALLWTPGDRRRPAPRVLAACAGAGLAAALGLVALLTLPRAGSLPQLGRLVDYARMFSVGGFNMMPIRGVLGFHVVIYATYVAAIVTATVRAARGASNRVLTGMLAWTGAFGLGAATYWVGRSHPVALKYAFPAWGFALMLLTLTTVRALAARSDRRPTIATVAVLFGFGLCACSIAQFPAPWAQIERLTADVRPTPQAPYTTPLMPSTNPRTRAFVSSLADGPSRFVVKRGAPVAILLTTGHRVADAYGIRNVSPYTGESIFTVQRVEAVIAALRKAGGNTVILPDPLVTPSMFTVLEREGFRLLTHRGLRRYRPHSGIVLVPWLGRASMQGVPIYVMKWVDTRHLHPRALR